MTNHTLIHHLNSFFPKLAEHHSSKDLKESELYKQLLPEIQRVLTSHEVGNFAVPAEAKKSYRAVTWNLERGICFEGIVETLKNNPILKEADLILAPETDLGMARSANRNIAQEMAKELKLNYFFGPTYINLAKGSGVEAEAKEENTLAIHGNAIFSRYPMKDFHLIPLKNNKDKMRGNEKRLGHQQVLAATIEFPGQELRVVCAHLDAHSSKRHRRDQMRTVLAYLKKLPELPTLFGGDLNTTTYNSRHAIFAIYGFWVRVAIGPMFMIKKHYPYPDKLFERSLFRSLEKEGFDYKNFNAPGVCTLHYDVQDLKKMKNLRDWVPEWCFKFIEWALRKNQGKCSFKIDWFAGKNLKVIPKSPQVIAGIEYEGKEVSDHDAIVVDFKF